MRVPAWRRRLRQSSRSPTQSHRCGGTPGDGADGGWIGAFVFQAFKSQITNRPSPGRRPVEVLLEKQERARAADGVRAVEKFNLRPLGNVQLGVHTADAGVYTGHPLVG